MSDDDGKYDPRVIVAFAMSLYSRARTIVIIYALLGAIVGGIMGTGLAVTLDHRDPNMTVVGFAALLVGALAMAVGQSRAFALRLQAQMALCQVQIEQNTRARARAAE